MSKMDSSARCFVFKIASIALFYGAVAALFALVQLQSQHSFSTKPSSSPSSSRRRLKQPDDFVPSYLAACTGTQDNTNICGSDSNAYRGFCSLFAAQYVDPTLEVIECPAGIIAFSSRQ